MIEQNSYNKVKSISAGNSQNIIENTLANNRMTSRKIFLQDYQRINDQYEKQYKCIAQNLEAAMKLKPED